MEAVKKVQAVPVRKEFITTWDKSEVVIIDQMSFQARQFFDPRFNRHGSELTHVLCHPETIKFNDLTPFFGRKTRVTIEVIE